MDLYERYTSIHVDGALLFKINTQIELIKFIKY